MNRDVLFGKFKSWNKSDIDRFLHQLVFENYLSEDLQNIKEIVVAYVKLGERAKALMTTDVKVLIII